MAYSRRMLSRNRKSTVSRQRNARRRLVRMSRAGYPVSSLARYSRVLSSTSGRPEVKLVDGLNSHGNVNTLAINSTGLVTPINLICVGSGFNNRVGRKIELQSCYITGMITQTDNANNLMDYGRILLVYDRQTNGATPSVTTILQNYDQQTNATTGVFCGVNPDERERFLVLMDERLALPGYQLGGPTSGTDGLNTTFNIHRFVKLRNLQTHYKADSSPAVIGDIATGALYILTIGATTAGNEGWQFSGTWRIRYKDT